MTHSEQETVLRRYQDITSVLTDENYGVVEASRGGPVGTMAWLRGEVCRFANGNLHAERRRLVCSAIDAIDSQQLQAEAFASTIKALASTGADQHVDVMTSLGRPVPMAVLARAVGASDPIVAATAVIDMAPAYLGTTDAAILARADAGVARLLELEWEDNTDGLAGVVARITPLLQACDVTAGLIAMSLLMLSTADGTDTLELLHSVVSEHPPIAVMRRATASKRPVTLDMLTANTQAKAEELPHLAFSVGFRRCPGAAQALALAGGVVEAIRRDWIVLQGQEPGIDADAVLRIPTAVLIRRRTA